MYMNKERIDYSQYFKTETLKEIARMFYGGVLEKEIDRLPYNIIAQGNESSFRCCVYKERAILKLRALAALGYSVNEIDEALPLSEYARQNNPDFSHKSDKLLTIMNSACKGCIKSGYFVTEACHGCLSRKCESACPFNAVKAAKDGANIDQSSCKKCGKCLIECPYGAIVKRTVPCEEACPVSAIKKNDNNIAVIDHSLCISCGKCLIECPFGAVMERSQFLDILKVLKSGKKVVAMLAPSIAGQFNISMGRLKAVVKELGFGDARQVALGADVTARKEAQEFKERVLQKGEKFMTTSCCHAYVRLVKKHLPELAPFVSHTATPVHYTAQIVKEEDPSCVTVFVSPCLAKRKEAQDDKLIDYVLSFEELNAMFNGKGVSLDGREEPFNEDITKEAMTFGIRGGVMQTVKRFAGKDSDKIIPELITGIDKKTVFRLKAFAGGNTGGANLIEVMSCQGGCVGGCNTINSIGEAAQKVSKYAGQAGK
jgi:[FeFe] hydrogenase (group B1/B3)